MRPFLLVATLTAMAAWGAGKPDQEILAALARQEVAWNRGDIPAFMEAYENSPDTTFVGAAGVTRGYQPVLENYKKRYPSRDAMGQLTYSDLEVHLLGDGRQAWVLGRFRLRRSAAGGGDKSGSFTLVFKLNAAGQWKIVLDHTS